MNFNTARGLLHDLIIGATQVDVTTGFIYWCYGGHDNEGHRYATIKGCAGMNIDAYDVCAMYDESWLEADIEEMDAEVEKLVNLIRG